MRVYKYSGSGNDFVFIDGRTSSLDEWPPDRIRAICERRHGVGADGLVIVVPRFERTDGAPVDTPRVRFNYFNADGHRSDMCGNGALCATRFASRMGVAPEGGLILETDIGDLEAAVLPGPDERAEIQLPDVEKPRVPNITRISGEAWVRFYHAGVPHLVIRVEDVDAESVDPRTRGRALRQDAVFSPQGTNVNFVSPLPDGSWRYRTYERGVEDETLACGTGAVAVAAAVGLMELRGREERDEAQSLECSVRLRASSGRTLEVNGLSGPDGSLSTIRLSGEGRFVFWGEWTD